jgi:tetratricopeptide (TPR) repeat protein
MKKITITIVALLLIYIMILPGCANPALEHLEIGNTYFDAGEFEQAIIEYDQAIEFDPELAVAYRNRCWAYYLMGNYQLAIADCSKAIELDPDLVKSTTIEGG